MPTAANPLPPLRVLDLTNIRGHFCGKVLGDMGCDVVKIEPPGGDPARDRGPFVDDVPDRNRSLTWLAYNTSKRGMTLNIESEDGRGLLRHMVEKADILLESFDPGYLDGLGVGYGELRRVKPDLIMTSITPFGQEGPYRDYVDSDIVLMALGGFMSENGYPDSPPIRMSLDQAYNHGGAYGAAATLTAYHHRETAGGGQHLDLSIQEAIMLIVDPVLQHWLIEGKRGTNRVGPAMRRGDVQMQLIWPCKDGYAAWRLFTGQPVGRRTHRIIDWAEQDGQDTGLKDVKWAEIDMNDITPEMMDVWNVQFSEFFRTHTKAELVRGAIERGLMLYPVNTVGDMMSDSQFTARDYFQEIEHPELGRSAKYPGNYWKSEVTPVRVRGRAPLIGEHNAEIYVEELGLSHERLIAYREAGVV